MFKSGYVSLVGRPNVGKSTLMERVMGEKLSIISDKAQTTRNEIKLIYTDEDMQIIFLDTPGIQTPKNSLGQYMLNVSESSLEESDIISMIVDTSPEIGRLDSYILDFIKDIDREKILLVNKIDLVKNEEVDRLVLKFKAMDIFSEILPISAKDNKGVEEYLSLLKELLPQGPMYYPDYMVTDKNERFIISELIREKALINLKEEVPHGINVQVESVKKREDKDLIDIDATIYVEKKSHKGIVIGKGGSMISKIGREARLDIENFLSSRVNLKLWVKVEEDWRKKEGKIKYFGYD